jgi:methionine biosynthesis protein MetW
VESAANEATADGDALRARRAWAYENPRPEIQALVPTDARRILDLGCSSGALGAALRERQGASVVGIEVDPGYAADARARLDEVVEADIEGLMGQADLEDRLGRFDCVIAGDVLEHLRDPWAVLRYAAGLLDLGGRAVVSLPNVRYWETFWQLGRRNTWPRRSEGIFDETHLRWFTYRDARALLEQAALEVVEARPQYRMRPGFPTRWDRHIERLDGTKLAPFFALQYVIGARRVAAQGEAR